MVVAHPAPCLFGQGHEGEKIGIQEGLPPPLQVNQVDPFQIRHQALKGGRGKMTGSANGGGTPCGGNRRRRRCNGR